MATLGNSDNLHKSKMASKIPGSQVTNFQNCLRGFQISSNEGEFKPE